MPYKDPAVKKAYNAWYHEQNGDKIRSQQRIYHNENRVRRNREMRSRWKANREEYKKACVRWRARLRQEVLDAYGNKCKCCGEETQEFLCVDHVKGGGRRHLKSIGGSDRFYAWLRKNKFPKRRFQLLCHNCNFAKSAHGKCPHQKFAERIKINPAVRRFV